MRAPLSWLREYVTVDPSAGEIARRLAISALEVERVIDVGVPDVDGNLGRFLVGSVLEARPHANARSTSVRDIHARSSAGHGTSRRARRSPSLCPARSCPFSTSLSARSSSVGNSRAG